MEPVEPVYKTALTLREWAEDKARRARLEELLNDPVFLEAEATFRSIMFPDCPEVVSTSRMDGAQVDLQEILALRYAHRAGFFGHVSALRNLTRELPLRVDNRNVPWGELLPEEPSPRAAAAAKIKRLRPNSK